MIAIIIDSTIGMLLLLTIIVRYYKDNKNETNNIRSQISITGESFLGYAVGKVFAYIGLLILLYIISSIVFIVAVGESFSNFSEEQMLLILSSVTVAAWLAIIAIKLPFSKASYKKWIDKAPERHEARKEALNKIKTNEKIDFICSWIKNNGEEEFAKYELNKLGMTPTKIVKTSKSGNFIIDNDNKKFAHFCVANDFNAKKDYWYFNDFEKELYNETATNKNVKKIVTDFANNNSTIALQSKTAKEAMLGKCFHISQFSKICKFQDLIRVEIVDKTQVDTQRTFTMESNAGEAIAGAFLGELLMGGVSSATVGAIAGAAGERTINEHVVTKKTEAYDVVLYLNRLDNSTYTIRVNSEPELRELVGVLEYILNNK